MQPLVVKVLILQVCITLAGLVIAFCLFDARSVNAALAAGFIAFIPALAYGRVVARITVVTPSNAVLLMHAIAGTVKLVLTVILLVLMFQYLQKELSMPFFFGAYISCLTSYGLALLFK